MKAISINRISQFYFLSGSTGWKVHTFLPFFLLRLATEINDKLCNNCPLAARAHPMVEFKKNHYLKLCTASVIRNDLLTLNEVFEGEGGCGAKNDDYQRAKIMFKNKLEV